MNSPVRQGSVWHRLVWSLIYPRRSMRAEPTAAGSGLVALSLGVGLAAYNSASNILFLALSLLMSSLVVSGILSWLNLRGLEWRLLVPRNARAGSTCPMSVILRNRRRLMPAYDLTAEFEARPAAAATAVGFAPKPEDPGRLLRQLWRATRPPGRNPTPSADLGVALQPGGERALTCQWTPARRGEWEVSLAAVRSQFPFGFLRKRAALGLGVRLLVRPEPIACEWDSGAVRSVAAGGARATSIGFGPDLHSLRPYRHGDSMRLIHWKASARVGELIVRQNTAEAAEGCWLELDPALWSEGEAFERAVRLTASVAERLFREGLLAGCSLGNNEVRRCTGPRDLEAALDRLAVVRAGVGGPAIVVPWNETAVVSIVPEGTEGVIAHAGNRIIARA
ncbi:hypothetical protein GALL_09780 [mine drainage metagenome]|uniref:DUF58 domain-containing protein n=1 Tax=mine drainage metagenome TaxID=410659 RepID=A0A1J5TCK2_9ZZZZ